MFIDSTIRVQSFQFHYGSILLQLYAVICWWRVQFLQRPELNKMMIGAIQKWMIIKMF